MPVETRISEHFGILVTEAMGSDTYGQAAIKTGISQAYLLAMRRGKVPTLPIVEKFYAAYRERVDYDALLIAAGYKEKQIDPIAVIACELRTSGKLTEAQQAVAMDQIRGFVDKIKKEYGLE
jgi:hypothetical protein